MCAQQRALIHQTSSKGSWEEQSRMSPDLLQPTGPVPSVWPGICHHPGDVLLNLSFSLGQLRNPRGRAIVGMEISFWRRFIWAFFGCFLQPMLSCVMWQVTPACGHFKSRVCLWRSGAHTWVQLLLLWKSISAPASGFKSLGVGDTFLKHRICSSSIRQWKVSLPVAGGLERDDL